MKCWAGLLAAAGLAAQTAAIHGTLLEWDGTAQAGQLSLRAPDHHVLVFQFDAGTVFDRPMRELESGCRLEIAAEDGPPSVRRYARGVRASCQPRPAAPIRPARWRAYRSPTERLFPRGNLALSGLVLYINDERLRLRTREGEQTILLRQDTRYLHDGSPVTLADIKINSRIFIRAGKNLENELEAFQVVWGAILRPR